MAFPRSSLTFFHVFPRSQRHESKTPLSPATPRQPLAQGRLEEGFMVGAMGSEYVFNDKKTIENHGKWWFNVI